MTNEELKKKICDTIAPYVSAYGDDERIADALILEGIGYVWDITEKAEKAIASLIKQNKELQHRAEVAERALDKACADMEAVRKQAVKEFSDKVLSVSKITFSAFTEARMGLSFVEYKQLLRGACGE